MKLTDEQRTRRNRLAARRMAEQHARLSVNAKAPAQIMVDPTRSHFFGDIPNGCWCGTHHYICDDCGADCTAGTSAGPCTSRDQLADGRRRCHACEREFTSLMLAAAPQTIEERDAIEEAIALVVGSPLTAVIRVDHPELQLHQGTMRVLQEVFDRMVRSRDS